MYETDTLYEPFLEWSIAFKVVTAIFDHCCTVELNMASTILGVKFLQFMADVPKQDRHLKLIYAIYTA